MPETILSTNAQVEAYLKDKGIFPQDTVLIVEDLRAIKESVEGFVNTIYRIRGDNGHSAVMKQVAALPISRAEEQGDGQPDTHLQDWTLDPGRLRNEISVLIFWNSVLPGICPEIYLFDEPRGIIVMEDLSHLSLLRYEFSRMKPFPLLGERLGDFFAHNLFYSSDLHMTRFRRKTMQDFFENPEYTALEPFLFEDCAIVSDHRTMPEATWPLRQSILTDTICQNEIKRLRQLFTTTKECLIHTDLHSSNIMVDEATVKIIDTEFAGFGPIAQDFGRLTASFCLNYLSWLGDDGSYTPAARLAYQESVLDILETMYTRFESTFQSLCQENQADSYILKSLDVEGYLRSHFVDALSYTALNAGSRIADRGLCYDLARLPEEERVYPQQLILILCRTLLTSGGRLGHITELTALLRKLPEQYPRNSEFLTKG